MTAVADAGNQSRFDPASLAGLDEPVRRYFEHAIEAGAVLGRGTRLSMRGRIKVGRWLRFDADWEGDGRSLLWQARAGCGRLRPLHVVDRYDHDATASMAVTLAGRLPLLDATDEDTVRSGAGRAAVESAIWAPNSLLPDRGVSWRAVSSEEIVADCELGPERPQVNLRIDAAGAIRSSWVNRWDGGSHGGPGYIPCGGEVTAERRFGGLTVPTRLAVGWWFGTPRYEPFFEAEIVALEVLR